MLIAIRATRFGGLTAEMEISFARISDRPLA